MEPERTAVIPPDARGRGGSPPSPPTERPSRWPQWMFNLMATGAIIVLFLLFRGFVTKYNEDQDELAKWKEEMERDLAAVNKRVDGLKTVMVYTKNPLDLGKTTPVDLDEIIAEARRGMGGSGGTCTCDVGRDDLLTLQRQVDRCAPANHAHPAPPPAQDWGEEVGEIDRKIAELIRSLTELEQAEPPDAGAVASLRTQLAALTAKVEILLRRPEHKIILPPGYGLKSSVQPAPSPEPTPPVAAAP